MRLGGFALRLKAYLAACAVLVAGCNTTGEVADRPGSEATAGPAVDLSVGNASTGTDSDGTTAEAEGGLAFAPHAREALASQSGQEAGGRPGSGEYRLNPLDVIEVSVFQVPDLARTSQINAMGQISMPLIGAVDASGKTPSELEREIAARLGARYLQSPEVTVFVKEYKSQRVTVDGAVNKPGIYQLTGQASLLQAVALAEGLDRVGDPSGVMVFRMRDGERHAAVFDLNAVRRGRAPDPVIQGGDVIVVDTSTGRTAWRAVRESVGVVGLFRPFML